MYLFFNFFFIIFIVLFFIGLLGVLINRKSLLIILMSIEVMLLAVNILFLLFSWVIDDSFGQIIVLFILTVAAAESAIGLAILVSYYRVHNTIFIQSSSLIQSLF